MAKENLSLQESQNSVIVNNLQRSEDSVRHRVVICFQSSDSIVKERGLGFSRRVVALNKLMLKMKGTRNCASATGLNIDFGLIYAGSGRWRI